LYPFKGKEKTINNRKYPFLIRTQTGELKFAIKNTQSEVITNAIISVLQKIWKS
jgi:hypothetical protein